MFYLLVLTSFLFFQQSIFGTLAISSNTLTNIISNGVTTGKQNNQPELVMNASGFGFAVWTDALTNQLFGNIFTPVPTTPPGNTTGSWGTAVELGRGNLPSIGIDSFGNAIAVFTNASSTTTNTGNLSVVAVVYNSTTKRWSQFQLSQATTQGINQGITAQLGTDQRGRITDANSNAIVLWTNQTGNVIFSTSVNLQTLTKSAVNTVANLFHATNVTSLMVLANNVGNVAAVWTTFDNQIQGVTFNVTSATTTPTSIPPTGVTFLAGSKADNTIGGRIAGSPNLEFDDVNYGIVTWQTFDTKNIIARRFPIP